MAVIAVYGSAIEPDESLANTARETGRLLANAKHTIITGACPGVTYKVAMGAHEAGGLVIGYSPAINLEEHTFRYQDPVDAFSDMVFLTPDYEFRSNVQACFKYRNIRTAMACDAAIIISGRMGTMNEFTLAYDFGKVIAVLEGTGGVADQIRDFLKSINAINPLDSILFSRDPAELINKLKWGLSSCQTTIPPL